MKQPNQPKTAIAYVRVSSEEQVEGVDQNLTELEYRTFLTAVNPFKAKNDPAQYAAMNAAINGILPRLAAWTPKIYIRSITWRDSAAYRSMSTGTYAPCGQSL